MKIFLFVGITTSLLNYSCQSHQSIQEAYLTNNGKGKYWDIVYSTSTAGVINHSYSIDDKNYKSLVYYCDYFSRANKIIRYKNLDSIRVIDRGHGTDIVYNPGKFSLTDSTLFFSGHKHKIVILTNQVMALEYEYENKKSLIIYVPSIRQNKIVMK